MSEGGGRKRKSKGWYRKQAYHNKRAKAEGEGEHSKTGHRLAPGLRGFIVTCNEREREAVKETYNLLNEYADKLYGPEAKPGDKGSGGDSSNDDDDIEAAIAKEVQGLKDAATTGERRFQNSHSGAKNCIFIKTSLDDPAGLALSIFRDLRESKVQKSRHALRLLPVVGTCKATVKEINSLAKEVLPPFFTEMKLEVTFTVTFKARNNNGLGREMVVSTLRQTIEDSFPSVRFTYNCPQVTVLVEVMCGVACIAVARDFALYRKYNLVEVALDKSGEEECAVKKEEKSEDKSTENSENALKKASAESMESCENVVQKNIGSAEKKEETPEDKPTETFSDDSKDSKENSLQKADKSMKSEQSVGKVGESSDREKETATPEGMSAEKCTENKEETDEAVSTWGPSGEAAGESKETSEETVQKASESTAHSRETSEVASTERCTADSMESGENAKSENATQSLTDSEKA